MKLVPIALAVFTLSLTATLLRGQDDQKTKEADARREAQADAQQAAASEAPKPDADGFFPLFNGKDLTGWKPNENPGAFKVQDGHLVVNGERAHLFYAGPVNNGQFKDFHFKAEVMTFPNSNSGIYFHTKTQPEGWPSEGFEAQVNNTYKKDPKKTGGLYGLKDVIDHAPVKDNEWFNYEIIVKGNHVQIKINGQTTADWTQPENFRPNQRGGRRIGSGTFALQAHDPESKVMYRNIRVKPL
jgi:hypothetical protein